METESKQAWGWFGLQSKPIRAFGAEGCVWPQAFAMLTSRGGFCSYWTFLRAVLMLESPSPVFFFIFYFFIWKPGKVSSQIKVDISGDWIWVFSKGMCLRWDEIYGSVLCSVSVKFPLVPPCWSALLTDWYFWFRFCLFLSDLQSMTQMGMISTRRLCFILITEFKM